MVSEVKWLQKMVEHLSIEEEEKEERNYRFLLKNSLKDRL